MEMEMIDRLLTLLDKAWVSSELSWKVKDELQKEEETEIEVTKVEVKTWDWDITEEMIDKMSESEVKEAFKKHLEKKTKWMKGKMLDKLNEKY